MADKEKVFISAAAGGLGHICVQWAKLRGCHVVGTCSTKEKSDMLKKLGCDRVINYKQENIDEVLTKEYPVSHQLIRELITLIVIIDNV
jgi:NADPH-dependent curcumin reductase CurA